MAEVDAFKESTYVHSIRLLPLQRNSAIVAIGRSLSRNVAHGGVCLLPVRNSSMLQVVRGDSRAARACASLKFVSCVLLESKSKPLAHLRSRRQNFGRCFLACLACHYGRSYGKRDTNCICWYHLHDSSNDVSCLNRVNGHVLSAHHIRHSVSVSVVF